MARVPVTVSWKMRSAYPSRFASTTPATFQDATATLGMLNICVELTVAPTHRPDRNGSVGVLPDEIGIMIAVDIAHPLNLPIGAWGPTGP